MDQETNNNSVLKRSSSQISQGSLVSGIDYGVVSTAPTPPVAPPMPHHTGSNLVTHFPSTTLSKDEMMEKKRVSIIHNGNSLNGSKHHSMSSNINIVTAPNVNDRHILPGVYK